MSLRVRMALVAGAAVALAVLAVAFASYEGTSSDLRGQVDSSLRSLTGSIEARATPPISRVQPGGAGPFGGSGLGFDGQGGVPQSGSAARGGTPTGGDRDEGLGFDQLGGGAFGGAPGLVTLVWPDGYRYSPPGQSYHVPVDARALGVARSGRGSYFADTEIKEHDLRVLVTGIGWRGALLVALPLSGVDAALDRQLLLLGLIAAGGVLLAALLGLVVARTALTPIARFTRQTEKIAERPERLESQRVEVHGSDELARLARTFNRTLDALERSVAAQRNLVADASHELRTPIATIRANLQLMRDEQLLTPQDREALRADVIEELDELTRLVEDVVELARGAKPAGEPGEVRLDQVVEEAVERTRRRAPQLAVQARIEPTLVHGEGARIARAVANLLDNAVKWSPPAGVIDVLLRDGVLTIRDQGPGFHEDELPYVFDRFHRAREARSKPGSGLGLAIVRQAAEAHGGFVEASNADGGGARLRISFGEPLPISSEGRERAVSPS